MPLQRDRLQAGHEPHRCDADNRGAVAQTRYEQCAVSLHLQRAEIQQRVQSSRSHILGPIVHQCKQRRLVWPHICGGKRTEEASPPRPLFCHDWHPECVDFPLRADGFRWRWDPRLNEPQRCTREVRHRRSSTAPALLRRVQPILRAV
eukprot:7347982-Prymnesium_polylepis.1